MPHGTRAWAVLVALLLCLAGPRPARAEAQQRVALVIGNGAYPKAALANPVSDAADMAAALRDAGFDVIYRADVGQREMERAVREFGKRIQRGGVGLFYYAGHGVQVDGRNYLLPVDADVESGDEIEFEALDAARVLAKMERADNALNMVFLDACRNNPYRSFRGLDRGLAITRYPQGTLISYATAPGSVAADGSGRNSPYSKHLVEAIRTPGIKVEEALKRVARAVNRETAGRQTPWVQYSLLPDFYFVPADATTAKTAAPARRRPAPSRPAERPGEGGPGFSLEDLEGRASDYEQARARWQSRLEQMSSAYASAEKFAQRTVPAELKAQGWQRFLDSYPDDDPYSGEDERMRGRAREQVARLEAVAEVGGDMVEVPAGEFWYGCNERVDRECDDDEKPGRTRSLDAFRIDRTEVTVAAYGECVDAGACSEDGLRMPYWSGGEKPDWAWACNWGKSGRAEHPINCVDWHQASAYCEWRGARLPSETEWEKAARGTDGRKYSWGNRGYGSGGKVANIADETAKRKQSGWTVAEGYDDGYYGTAPVGSFPAGASPYGPLDMIGNVWEWTSDWYSSEQIFRVVRGGSWLYRPRSARASNRGWYATRNRYENIGFRCAQ